MGGTASQPRKKFVNWKRWRTVGLILGYYTFLTLVYIPQVYVGSFKYPHPYPILPYIVGHLLWFLVTLLIIKLCVWFPLLPPLLLKNLMMHLLCAILISSLFTIVYFSALGFIDGIGFGHLIRIARDGFLITKYITNSFVFYIGISALIVAVSYYNLFKEREFRLQQAELETLKTQLRPHFLFNTLNAIATLAYVSPPVAVKTISQLSDLLRTTLQSNKRQEVALKEELDFLRKYIQIQQTLLKERLEVECVIEPETLDALVPNMLLQPLVENSIRHGLVPKEDGGRIEIRSRRIDDRLLVEIKDDGLGSESVPQEGGGTGLINLRARLIHLYGEKQKFEIDSPPGGGWHISITLPFRKQAQIDSRQDDED